MPGPGVRSAGRDPLAARWAGWLGDGTDSFDAVGGLAGGDGAWPELAGRVEQGSAQVRAGVRVENPFRSQ